jgi:PAS domain S-box-containing protein
MFIVAESGATGSVLKGYYSLQLVALSVFIAMIASYAALDLAGRMRGSAGRIRAVWLCGGATAMGIGIWSMHYVGMEAFHLPVPVRYDWPTVLVSLVAAVLASALALLIVSGRVLTVGRLNAGSFFMGSGIAAMHYIGMSAMRLPAVMLYNPWLVLLSVVLAIGSSGLALRLGFALRNETAAWGRNKIGAALIMGCAIPSMHYVGMAAATFVSAPIEQGSLHHAVTVSGLAFAGIIVVTLMVLLVAITTSIVDRVLSLHAQRLASSRIQLQMIFENMAEGLVVVDRGFNIVQANQAAVHLLNLSSKTMTVAEVTRLFESSLPDGSILARDMQPSSRAFRGEFLDDFRMRIRRRDSGKIVTVEVTTRPIPNEAGETSEIMISYRDVTERDQLDQVRSRLAAIVESSEDAIFGCDPSGIVTSWNRGAERLFGYLGSEMLGQSIQKIIPPDHAHEGSDILSRIAQEQTVSHMETVRRRRDGQLIQVALSISPIRGVDGAIVGSSRIARNITDMKLLQRQLQQSQKMEAIGQLTGGVAHDFNNLLGVIIGNLDLLERAVADNQPALKRVHIAQKAAGRGADLTKRLLAFSSREELSPCATGLSDSVRNTTELAARTLGPEIKIVTECDPSLPPAFVDPSRLESALLNLVVNARDAMPGGGTITISTRLINLEENYPAVRTGELATGAYASVCVSDTGHGMSRETAERAFEPFFTTKPRGKGTGLGLAMVYGFARQSGGTARIYSEPGYGTTVSLYLPFATTPDDFLAEPEKTSLQRVRGKVLVVDDEEDLLEVAVVYLEAMGHVALHAKDAATALGVAAREPDIDVMVTDILMPGGMNGVELARKMRELNPRIRIVYSSGFPADALMEKSGASVEGPLLHKPYQRSEFIEMIHRVMEEGDGVAVLH